MENGLKHRSLLASIILSALAAAGCSSESSPPPPLSTDFATSAIEAEFEVNVFDDDMVQLKAIFNYRADSIQLDSGDSVLAVANGVEFPLTQSTDSGEIVYVYNYTTSSLPSLYNFVFQRTTQETADLSIIPTPQAFSFSNLIDDQAISAVNGMVNIQWTPSSTSSDLFYLTFHLECRNQSGTPSITRDVTVSAEDNGEYDADITAILGTGDYDLCTDFDITAERIRYGSLDATLGGGSTTGRQVRTLSNLSINPL